MENNTKKFLSIGVIVLGVMDAITVLVSLAAGTSSQSGLAQDSGLTGIKLQLLFGIVVVICSFLAISTLYAGIEGLNSTKGKEVSTYTKVFTTVIVILTGISSVIGLISVLQGIRALSKVLSTICSFIIWLNFKLTVLKKVKE